MSMKIPQTNQRRRQNPRTKALRKAAVTISETIAGPQTIVKAKSRQQRATNALGSVRSAPVNTSITVRGIAPNFTGTKNGIRIKHREFVSDIISANTTGAFKSERYILNAANSDTFPWLSNQARSYSEYKFHNLTFILESLTATSTNGMMGLASSPDINDSAPGAKPAFMQLQNSVRGKIWDGCSHPVPRDILTRLPQYLTSSNNLTTLDTTRDMGNVYICSSDTNAGITIAELYVEYDVELSHPQEVNGLTAEVHFTPVNNILGIFGSSAELQNDRSNVLVTTANGNASYTTNAALEIDLAGPVGVLVVVTAAGITQPPLWSYHYGSTTAYQVTIPAVDKGTTNTSNSYISFVELIVPQKPFFMNCVQAINFSSVPQGFIYVFSLANRTSNVPLSLSSLNSRLDILTKHIDSAINEDDEYIVSESTPTAHSFVQRPLRSLQK